MLLRLNFHFNEHIHWKLLSWTFMNYTRLLWQNGIFVLSIVTLFPEPMTWTISLTFFVRWLLRRNRLLELWKQWNWLAAFIVPKHLKRMHWDFSKASLGFYWELLCFPTKSFWSLLRLTGIPLIESHKRVIKEQFESVKNGVLLFLNQCDITRL